jgi:hypothetical protein
MSVQQWLGIAVSVCTLVAAFATLVKWLVKNQTNQLKEEFKEELRPMLELLDEMDKRNLRIEYALYNDGKTGLINKVEELLKNQQEIKVDVEVLKSKE